MLFRSPREEDGDEDEGQAPTAAEEADLQGLPVLPIPREDAGSAERRDRYGDLP